MENQLINKKDIAVTLRISSRQRDLCKFASKELGLNTLQSYFLSLGLARAREILEERKRRVVKSSNAYAHGTNDDILTTDKMDIINNPSR